MSTLTLHEACRPLPQRCLDVDAARRELIQHRQVDAKELGAGMSRVTIAKIEGGGKEHARASDRVRADNVTLAEVLVLSAALDVPPVLLFTPLEAGEVHLGAKSVDPLTMLDWVCGDEPLRFMDANADVGVEQWKQNADPLDFLRRWRSEYRRAKFAEELRFDDDDDNSQRHSELLDKLLRRLEALTAFASDRGTPRQIYHQLGPNDSPNFGLRTSDVKRNSMI